MVILLLRCSADKELILSVVLLLVILVKFVVVSLRKELGVRRSGIKVSGLLVIF